MADKYIALDTNGLEVEVEATVVSSGSGNAGEVVGLDASGKLDVSVLPVGVGPAVKSMTASEALTAPAIVNVHNSSGEKVRYADASTAAAARQAVGFILASIANGAAGNVYFEGEISGFVGLTPGATYFLSDTTPGGVVITPVTTAGRILQRVGVATSATTIDFEPSAPIIRG